MKPLGLIIQREYVARVKTKAFLLTTILVPIAFIFMAGLPAIIMNMSDSDIKKVFVIDNTGLYANLFESSDTYEFIHITANENAEKGAMDALLEINGDLSKNPSAASFYSEKQQPPRELTTYINDVLTEAVRNAKIAEFTAASNIEPQVVTDLQQLLKTKNKIHVNTLRWSEDGKTTDTLGDFASGIGMALTFVMFFFITMYGSLVMQSVVEEKSNRIIEVIISSAKPFDLMMGKIISVALTGLTQLVIWIGVGSIIATIVGFSFMGNANVLSSPENQQAMTALNSSPDLALAFNGIASINWIQVVVCFILYFIGGYLMFASLFAMFGSAANDSQEAQQFIMPVTILLLVSFYTGYAAARNPEGSMAFWTSIIPFTSPVVMMVRTPFEVPIWELLLSLTLLYTTAILMIKLSSKIYRVGILMYGKKASFGEIFKWIRYK